MLKSHRSNISLACEITQAIYLSSCHYLDLGVTHATHVHDVRLHIVSTDEMIPDTQSANIPRSKMSLIYQIMKTMRPTFKKIFGLVYCDIVLIFH